MSQGDQETKFMEQIPWEGDNHSTGQEHPYFMVPKVLVLCLQEPATGPYPEPNELYKLMVLNFMSISCCIDNFKK
jgi:hypothetical protein